MGHDTFDYFFERLTRLVMSIPVTAAAPAIIPMPVKDSVLHLA